MRKNTLRLTALSMLFVGMASTAIAAPVSNTPTASDTYTAPTRIAWPASTTIVPGTGIQEQSKGQILASLARDHAIKTVRGNGKRVLYVFSDPDCSYCKKLEHTLRQVENVTIYTFLYPLEGLHPQATEHARGIWCSNDRSAAWQSWMLGNVQPAANDQCSAPIAQNRALGLALGLRGTPTLFNAGGRMAAGAVSAQSIEALLAE
ncbi:DsbC family protein [Burkholderia multivorans]|uniref:DsbC family protein n=1 Tax=Burkholderia multivorans TaxID=87883 RepID=UPI0015E43E64|nr:DsbC family protein [Burkholderia multivorans]